MTFVKWLNVIFVDLAPIVHDIPAWCRVLGVLPEDIKGWLTDDKSPMPKELDAILSVLEESWTEVKEVQDALAQWRSICGDLINVVAPELHNQLIKWHTSPRRLNEYRTLAYQHRLERALGGLTEKSKRQVLQDATANAHKALLDEARAGKRR